MSASRLARAGIALLAFGATARAARAQDIPEFNKLHTPVSPAFTILGIAPVEVERPTMPSTFAASVLQKSGELSAGLPRSFAVDVAPYWMVAHPGLTFTDYQKGGWASIYRNATLSLATTDSTGSTAAAANPSFRRIGFGVRTLLVAGQKNPVVPKCISELSASATGISVIVGGLIADTIAKNPSLASDAKTLETLRDRFYTRALETFPSFKQDSLKKLTTACTKNISSRTGFTMDGAVAGAATFADGAAQTGKLSSAGVWLTPALLGQNFSNIAVLRMRWDDLSTDSSATSLDVGARTVYAWDRYATSLELVNRSERRKSTTSDFVRVSLGLDAKVSGDTWLNLSFGKDFDPRKKNSLLALIGFQWQLGERSVQPDK